MAIMSATERQLTRQIIGERDERARAVNDLWAKLRELQEEVGRATQTSGAGSRCSNEGPLQESHPVMAEMRALRIELQNHQQRIDTHDSQLNQVERNSVELKASLHRAEVDIRGRFKEDLVALVSQEGQARFGNELGDEQVASGAAKGSGTGGSDCRFDFESLLDKFDSAKPDDESLASLRSVVSDIEVRQQHILDEISTLRALLVEVHVNLPLHAVRASRIALRSTELSREERKLALASLESKEQQIRSDIEKVRERSDSDLRSISVSLTDIRNAIVMNAE
eukprot:CAMPEP_0172669702 /NCGR_PEP_ID=MMETSP1074-20121228/9852_1 /TAXON_ID=2916 /ORGANISM="Ceratium fusus, Strain PA161109" /LENGTH=281 /DNA_ID=CAMNT_0013486515 /DNA_START=152 /DNA_END=997 /DNA_ORIENTATION=-